MILINRWLGAYRKAAVNMNVKTNNHYRHNSNGQGESSIKVIPTQNANKFP